MADMFTSYMAGIDAALGGIAQKVMTKVTGDVQKMIADEIEEASENTIKYVLNTALSEAQDSMQDEVKEKLEERVIGSFHEKLSPLYENLPSAVTHALALAGVHAPKETVALLKREGRQLSFSKAVKKGKLGVASLRAMHELTRRAEQAAVGYLATTLTGGVALGLPQLGLTEVLNKLTAQYRPSTLLKGGTVIAPFAKLSRQWVEDFKKELVSIEANLKDIETTSQKLEQLYQDIRNKKKPNSQTVDKERGYLQRIDQMKTKCQDHIETAQKLFKQIDNANTRLVKAGFTPIDKELVNSLMEKLGELQTKMKEKAPPQRH